jgi:hypothetical protein
MLQLLFAGVCDLGALALVGVFLTMSPDDDC